jgi:hypothetical protein
MSQNAPKRDNQFLKERLREGYTLGTAVSATTTIPICTSGSDYVIDKFEIEVPGGYVEDPANYYVITLQNGANGNGVGTSNVLATHSTQSAAAVTFTAVAATDICTATAHGLVTGSGIQVANSGGALPAGLAATTTYFAIVIDANTFKLATSLANALAGTAIDITTNGTGTQTFLPIALTDLVFVTATLAASPVGSANDILVIVMTKHSSAPNLPVGTNFNVHFRLI